MCLIHRIYGRILGQRRLPVPVEGVKLKYDGEEVDSKHVQEDDRFDRDQLGAAAKPTASETRSETSQRFRCGFNVAVVDPRLYGVPVRRRRVQRLVKVTAHGLLQRVLQKLPSIDQLFTNAAQLVTHQARKVSLA